MYFNQIFMKLLFSFRIQYLFKPKPGEHHPDHFSYRALFPKIIQDIEVCNICLILYLKLLK